MKVSIVILTYNRWDLLYQCLMSVVNNYHHNIHEVIVIDNGTDETIRIGMKFFENLSSVNIKRIHPEVNLGYPNGMNFGIDKLLRVGNDGITILMTDDTYIIKDGLFEEIEQVYSAFGDTLLGQSLYTHDTGWNTFGDIIVPYVEGYFIVAPTNFLKNHKFDEIYGMSDFEDVDLSAQAIKEGMVLKQLSQRYVEHLGGRSFGYGEDRQSRTRMNRIKFAKKWNLL